MFRSARRRMHKNLKSAREEYVCDNLGEAIKDNPKRFWSYIKRLNQEDLGVADFEVGGNVISDGRLKSEILNNQFSSVFTKENLENIPEVGCDPKPSLGPLIIS